MQNDSKSWMEGTAERSIRAFLMTAEELMEGTEPLDSDDAETLHWCWEGIHHIVATKLAIAQLDAHQAANAPASIEDMMRMIRDDINTKLSALTGDADQLKT